MQWKLRHYFSCFEELLFAAKHISKDTTNLVDVVFHNNWISEYEKFELENSENNA